MESSSTDSVMAQFCVGYRVAACCYLKEPIRYLKYCFARLSGIELCREGIPLRTTDSLVNRF